MKLWFQLIGFVVAVVAFIHFVNQESDPNTIQAKATVSAAKSINSARVSTNK